MFVFKLHVNGYRGGLYFLYLSILGELVLPAYSQGLGCDVEVRDKFTITSSKYNYCIKRWYEILQIRMHIS